MDKPTPQESVEFFAKHTSHWESFLEGFMSRREDAFRELRNMSSNPQIEPLALGIKTGEMAAYGDIYDELTLAGEEALRADQQ